MNTTIFDSRVPAFRLVLFFKINFDLFTILSATLL